MRIAFLADSFLHDASTGVNGTQVQMFNLATAFARRGVDVRYAAFTRDPGLRDGAVDGLGLHWLPAGKGPFGWAGELRSARRALDGISADAVYQRGRSHLTFAAAGWARRCGRRFVWASNGEDSGERWKQVGRLGRAKKPWWKKAVLYPCSLPLDLLIHRGVEGATRVIAQTEHQRQRIHATFGHDAVVLPSVFPAPASGDGCEKERLVLWLANLNAGKQPELFLRLADALQGLDGWTFVLAGGTSDRAFAEALAAEAAGIGNLHLAGPVAFAETDALFARASLFVSTSVHEGVSNTFIQSWLHGTPVLSFVVDPNGWIAARGLGYCAGGDADALVAEARRLLDRPGELAQMGERCRAFARETFAADAVIDAYLQAFAA